MKTENASRFGLRLCAVAAFGSLAIASVGLAAPASATVPLPETGSAPTTLLGWTERTVAGHDEWRADFTVRVPAGTEPTTIDLTLKPVHSDAWYNLAKIDDVQSSVNNVYSIVHRVKDGAEDLLYISARSDVATLLVTDSVTRQVGLRVTMADGTTTTRHAVENVGRNVDTGRPVPINAWDYTTADLPGYHGPNSQTGWGNVIEADSAERLVGIKFHVDALNSGRSVAAGCDVTDLLYYQFVRGDNGEPASITPTPQQTPIADHASGVQGTVLINEGRFSLDAPGYYKLMVWPQARSSHAGATQDCSAVSYDPAVLSEGTQVGSVFWKMPKTGSDEVNTVTPVSMESPVAGEVLTVTTPVFAGKGHPGATVEVTNDTGALHGSALVDDQGWWYVTSTIEHADGSYTATATQTMGDKVSSATGTYSVQTGAEVTPVSLETPADDEVISVAKPVFSGKGNPGATVLVRGSSGKVLAAATVDASGNWSVESMIELTNGGYVGTVEQAVNGVTTTAPFRYSIRLDVPPFPGLPFAVTSPTFDGMLNTTIPVFTGTGMVGALVEVRGNSGRVLASATVDDKGMWSATSTLTLAAGPYVGTVFHTADGVISTQPIQYRIATGLSLISPVNGGPAAGPLPIYTGTGQPGATVEIRGSSGRTVASATVDANGKWTAQADFELSLGWYVGTIVQIIDGADTHSAPISYSVV